MIDYKKEFDEAILRINTYTNSDDKLQKEYMPGIKLYPREMHTLVSIFDNPDINTTGLSRLTGFTKGTVSKMMKRFGELGLVDIYKHDDNFKEVHYSVTDLGEQVCDAHAKFHETHGHEFYESFDLLPERSKALMVATLNEYADYMKSYSTAFTTDSPEEDEEAGN